MLLEDGLASRLSDRRVLVTGASGFVGANLVRTLVAAGCSTYALVRPGGRHWRLDGVADAPVVLEADLADERALDRVFAQARPEFVFHLAVPRGDTEAARDAMLRVTVVGAHRLMRLVREYRVDRLVVAGRSLEYAPSTGALTEERPLAPSTWHGATKAAAHLLYRQAALAEGLPVVLLRLFHVYGPWESAHRLAPAALYAAFGGLPLPLTERGIRRDWVFVEDVVEAMLRAALDGRSATSSISVRASRPPTKSSSALSRRRPAAVSGLRLGRQRVA